MSDAARIRDLEDTERKNPTDDHENEAGRSARPKRNGTNAGEAGVSDETEAERELERRFGVRGLAAIRASLLAGDFLAIDKLANFDQVPGAAPAEYVTMRAKAYAACLKAGPLNFSPKEIRIMQELAEKEA